MPPQPPAPPSPSPPPLRILMLHGYTQTPTLFRAKTRALAKSLSKPFPALHLSYVPAPHRLLPADIPGSGPAAALDDDDDDDSPPDAYGWWRRKDRIVHEEWRRERIEAETEEEDEKDEENENEEVEEEGGVEIVYSGIEEGLQRIADCIRSSGPFDGVIGFSQGAAAAAMVAALLEGEARKEAFDELARERKKKKGGMRYPECFLDDDVDGGFVQGPLRFAVCYSGFRAPGRLYEGFYEPRIRTRVLHVLGQVDVVVDEGRGRELVGACEGGEGWVVVHPGGHFVPSQKPWLDAVVGFVKKCMEGEGKGEKEDEVEERVEDMDVPF